MPPPTQQGVQRTLAVLLVELRLVAEVVHDDGYSVQLFVSKLLGFCCQFALLLDDGPEGPLVPGVEKHLFALHIDAHLVLDELDHGLPGIVDQHRR